MKTEKTMTKAEVVHALMQKDEMEKNSSPKLSARIKERYEEMSNHRLADMYWYVYHTDVYVTE